MLEQFGNSFDVPQLAEKVNTLGALADDPHYLRCLLEPLELLDVVLCILPIVIEPKLFASAPHPQQHLLLGDYNVKCTTV